MNKIILSLLASLSLLTAAYANEFTFSQAGLKLNVPNGFALMPRADIELLFPPNRGPGFMVGNANRSVTLSYDLKPHDIAGVNLASGIKIFEQVFEKRVPGLSWKERKVVDIEKQGWMQLEFLSKSAGVEYHNIMLITPMKGQMLVLNFSAALPEFPAVEAQLRESIKSIALNVAPPVPVASPVPEKKEKARK